MLKTILKSTVLLASCICIAACVAYNDQCQEEEHDYLAHSEVLFDIRPEYIRAREAPIGNLVADAALQAASEEYPGEIHFAFIEASTFTTYTPCQPRDFIERGKISDLDIEYLLSPDQKLLVVSLSPAQVKGCLERSVRDMGDSGAEKEALHFLQVSKNLSFEVDCSQLAYIKASNGAVRQGLRVNDNMIFINNISLSDWPSSEAINVVITEQLSLGVHGHDLLADASVVSEISTSLIQATKRYLDLIGPITFEDVRSYDAPGIASQRSRIRPYPNCFEL